MADPTLVPLTAETWTLVLSGVTCGIIKSADTGHAYKYTYREAGGTAPTDETDAMILVSNKATISHSSPVDVYFISKRVAGSLLVMV